MYKHETNKRHWNADKDKSFSFHSKRFNWRVVLLFAIGSILTWADLQKVFLDKYFPPKKANSLKKAISNIEQDRTKTLYEYHERFKRLCSSCPFHGYSTQDLVLHLYNGLLDNERRMVDVACGGNILNKTATAAMDMFKEMAEGSREFGRSAAKQGVSAVDSTSSAMMSEITELK